MKDFMIRIYRMKRPILVGLIMSTALILFAGFMFLDSDYFFRINKSIDIFGRVYREITLNYVDEVDPEKFMESGINGMLSTLDPYTNFINASEGDEVELITTGRYGGIGITVGLREGFVTILTLMEGYSAQRQGLQPGDRMIAIDGKDVTGTKPDGIRSMTRGEPGTEVRVRVEREGELKPLDFTLVREEIQLKNITYANFVRKGVAYVRLERFTRGAGDELLLAIRELQLKGEISSFVLDLRDNPGGLLDVAVDIVEKFVPKGSLVVSTRGRKPDSERKYYSIEEPTLPNVPLVVLINHNSASASEIVAGAIQDLDRGIVLGERSFGKGLVQTIAPLPYNTQIKITTAKYYTPSGRCIQEIDYMHKNKDGVFAVMPESLRQQFKTLKGRSEYERGGITPDSIVPEPGQSTLHKELLRKSMYFRFASRYTAAHPLPSPAMESSELRREFQRYLDEQKFTYEEESEKRLKELRELAMKSSYDTSVIAGIDRLATQVGDEKAKGIERHQAEILRAVKTELMSRHAGEKGRIETSFEGDLQFQAASGLLQNGKEYERRLTIK